MFICYVCYTKINRMFLVMDTMNCKRFLLGAVTCAMVMNLEGVAATKATKINGKREQELLLNHVWQQDAYLYISSRWKNSNLENCPWWKQFKYEDSIFAVIPKAIADFVLKQDVFGNKDNYVFGQTNRKFSLINLIKFTGAEPTSMKYTPANWNALVLYNFISKFILDTNDSIQIREVIDIIKKDLNAYYNNSFQDEIEKAAKDINTYIEDLALTGYLKEVKEVISKKSFAQNAQNAVNTALSKDNKKNILSINYTNVIPTDALFNEYNQNKIFPTYQAPEEAEAQLQFRISFPAYPNDTYKPIKPKLDFIPMNKGTKFEDNYESLPTTKTSGLLKFVPNKSQNAEVGLELVLYPSWKNVLRNELPKKYALDIKGFDVNEMNKLLMNNFEKQWLKVRNKLRAKDCLGNDYDKSLQILKKLKNLDIIQQIYGSDDEILLYCHNLKQENQHYTAKAYSYILDVLNDYCAKVFYACKNTNISDISDFQGLQKFVNRLLKHNWDEERAEAYTKFLNVAEEIMEYGIYDDDAMVLNELLLFETQKYQKACKDCLTLYEDYCMSDKIKGAGAEVVKLLLQGKGSEAELRVQTILAQRFYGDENYKSEIEKSAGSTYEEQVNNCAKGIKNKVNNLYNEYEGEYGISNFKNKDEIKGKIIDLHCDTDKIAEWIEGVLLNN